MNVLEDKLRTALRETGEEIVPPGQLRRRTPPSGP